jgi:hypothetical protein
MTVAVTTYVAALTQTSAVVAAAYVDVVDPVTPVVGSASASSLVSWGLVAVGIAFSNTPVPLVLNPEPAVAYSTVSGGNFVGRNILPVTATAIVQQSNTVTPPGPAAQLTFFWG